ncbi:MAG: hypothetical protein ACOC80_13315 [Petrotogales bacterium]
MKSKSKYLITALMLATLFSILSIPASAEISVQSTEMEDVGLTGSDAVMGPGSEAVFRSPVEYGYTWIYQEEPVQVHWKIYNPKHQIITTISHTPTFKKQITEGEYKGLWAVADETSFTIPAFADKGYWLAQCQIELADGTKAIAISAEQPDARYLSFDVNREGDLIENIFTAPMYWFGWKGPAVFWIPGVFIWAPLLFVAIAAVLTHSLTGFVDVLRGLRQSIRGARRKWTT